MQEKTSVMFVDDDFNTLKAMRRMADPRVYDVATASGGEEAIGLLQKHPVDILVVDYEMPLMNGMALLMQARVIYPKTVRILCTGAGDMKVLTDAINHGEIFRYIPKPVTEAELNRVLVEASRHAKLQA